MASDNARILVIGAGVNGSVCAAWLSRSGLDVTVLARGRRVAEIETNGLIIENALSHKRTVARVRVINELASGDIYDYILVVVRRNQVAGLLPALAANRSPNVVFMNNNLNGPAEIVAALGPQRPMLGFVFVGGRLDGEIARVVGPFRHPPPVPPYFGEIDGSITPRLNRLVNLLNQAGLTSKASANVVDYLATHAACVAVMAPLSIKYATATGATAPSTEDLRLTAAAMRETIPVLEALEHKIVPANLRLLSLMPVSLLTFLFRKFSNSRMGRAAATHGLQAPDELQALADDLRAAVTRSGLAAPAIRKLLEMK